MDMDKLLFIKTDDNKIINVNLIRWVQKIDECLAVCSKFDGCTTNVNTHSICKAKNLDSYNRLNKYFE